MVKLVYADTGAVAVSLFAEIVPSGVQSVNGSKLDMGCAYPLDSVGDLKCCSRHGNQNLLSYLSDRVTPEINTHQPDWASKLLTVRKNTGNAVVPFDHVILTFGFETAITAYNIELDLFLCPEWKIDAPFITVYASNNRDMVFRQCLEMDFLMGHVPRKKSCDRLTTVSVRPERMEPYYHYWHIVVSFQQQMGIEWVHVGEVRFLEVEIDPSSSQEPLPSVTQGELLCSGCFVDYY